jgi:RNA polymerase sigma-70 factor (ECF subfamily)
VEHALTVRAVPPVFDFLGAPAESVTMRRHDRDREFETQFLALYDSVLQSVTYVCGDRDRAADAVQEAFIRAYARWSRLREYDNLAAWVRRTAINITRDAHRSDTRRLRRERRVAVDEAVVDATPSAGSSPLDLLAGLPDRQRAIAALYYLDDFPVDEIARVLGIAEGTVRFHLSEARQRLRNDATDRRLGNVR